MFQAVFLKALAILPALITGMENIFGAGNGKTKLAQTEAAADMIMQTANFIASKDIVDVEEFAKQRAAWIAATVGMLNASIWSKNKKAVPAA